MDAPKSYQAIMVSSTFTDLKDHRKKVIKAIEVQGYRANVMEHDGARADLDVIGSSLKFVRDSAAYVGVISRKYGQTPYCPERNPDRLSITELEFNEAMRLDRPILLFVMGEKHPVTEADIELDPEKRKKLDAFRQRAKRMRERSEVDRVYQVFESLEQFSNAAATAIGRLAEFLRPDRGDAVIATDEPEGETALPRPPNLAALPRYLGSHPFVGRASELQTLTDWCGPADPNPMLLFEAMGGSGKSMLTWEWLTNHATGARGDWAGRFWYSFYEKGAVMASFCRQALAYMTMKPVGEFAKLRTPELSDRLVSELEKRPWLMVLDGLERILVAYHRHDAAQIRDEEADTTADQIGKRDPCTAIRPEDDDLLRRLAAVAPSKILVSSRLMPLALVNRAGIGVPGVRHEILPGLRPADAEAMIRACGVAGRSLAIQAYLQTNCDCHPLVIGALAGLINNYPPDRGNFDHWSEDPHYGGALNLADLDLVQRRNHILLAAIDALAPPSRQLLQTLALLQSGADFETLIALNPHLPPEPDEAAVRAAPGKLGETLRDLEKRGLLQYDHSEKRYDLHPVVRGVAVGRMAANETLKLGQMVVDYFSGQPHDPWEQAESLDDLEPGLQVVRVLIRMGRHQGAFDAFRDDLVGALHVNLRANTEMQALLKPFFPDGWDNEPVKLDEPALSHLLNVAALSFNDYPERAKKFHERGVFLDISRSDEWGLATHLCNLVEVAFNTNRMAEAARLVALSFEIAEAMAANDAIFVSKLDSLFLSIEAGDHEKADRLWRELDGTPRPLDRGVYRTGDMEKHRVLDLFYRGELTEEILARAEASARHGRNFDAIRKLHLLRGEWCLARNQPALAVVSLAEAVRMSREAANEATRYEALLALARLRTGMEADARREAERLTRTVRTSASEALAVAELWHALGERDIAVEHAFRAHRLAVAEGEPYVHRYYLNCTRAFLAELGATLPEVPRYDPATTPPYHWEPDIRAFIERLRAESIRAQQHSGTASPRMLRVGTSRGSALARMRAGHDLKAQQ